MSKMSSKELEDIIDAATKKNKKPNTSQKTAQKTAQGQQTGVASFGGDGEFIMKIRRFIPDFISQTGNTQVTLQLRNFPNDSQASSSLGPFTVSSSTQKVDTRARARGISLKVENKSSSQSWKLGTFRLDVQPDGRR